MISDWQQPRSEPPQHRKWSLSSAQLGPLQDSVERLIYPQTKRCFPEVYNGASQWYDTVERLSRKVTTQRHEIWELQEKLRAEAENSQILARTLQLDRKEHKEVVSALNMKIQSLEKLRMPQTPPSSAPQEDSGKKRDVDQIAMLRHEMKQLQADMAAMSIENRELKRLLELPNRVSMRAPASPPLERPAAATDNRPVSQVRVQAQGVPQAEGAREYQPQLPDQFLWQPSLPPNLQPHLQAMNMPTHSAANMPTQSAGSGPTQSTGSSEASAQFEARLNALNTANIELMNQLKAQSEELASQRSQVRDLQTLVDRRQAPTAAAAHTESPARGLSNTPAPGSAAPSLVSTPSSSPNSVDLIHSISNDLVTPVPNQQSSVNHSVSFNRAPNADSPTRDVFGKRTDEDVQRLEKLMQRLYTNEISAAELKRYEDIYNSYPQAFAERPRLEAETIGLAHHLEQNSSKRHAGVLRKTLAALE